MTISKGKKRLVITMEKERAAEIEQAAREANRTISNYLETVILKHKEIYERGMELKFNYGQETDEILDALKIQKEKEE